MSGLALTEDELVEFEQWQAEIAARQKAAQAAEDAKADYRAQRMRALLGPTGGVGPHVPVKPSRQRQDPREINKHLAAERSHRATRRAATKHVPPKPAPEHERKPWNPAEAFSIGNEKQRKKAEAGPRARPGQGRRRCAENKLRWMADVARAGRRLNQEE